MSKVYLVDKESVRQIGRELWQLRREKNLLLQQVEKKSGVPAKIVESLELERYLQYGFCASYWCFTARNCGLFWSEKQTLRGTLLTS